LLEVLVVDAGGLLATSSDGALVLFGFVFFLSLAFA
jgi:hypothetical protein